MTPTLSENYILALEQNKPIKMAIQTPSPSPVIGDTVELSFNFCRKQHIVRYFLDLMAKSLPQSHIFKFFIYFLSSAASLQEALIN